MMGKDFEMSGDEKFFISTQLIPFAPSVPFVSFVPQVLLSPLSHLSQLPQSTDKKQIFSFVSICVYRQGTYFFKREISSCVKLLPGNHGLVMGNKVDGVRSDTNMPQRLYRLVGANIARHYANLMLVE